MTMTNEELKEYAETHFRYELEMLMGTASMCAMDVPIDSLIGFPIHNAVIESFSIHARNLISFLYPTKKDEQDKSNVTILNYLKDGNDLCHRPEMPQILKDAKSNANKQVAHLTTDRFFIFHEPEQRMWNFIDIFGEIIRIFNMLEPYFDNSKISEDFGSYLRDKPSIYKFDYSFENDHCIRFSMGN